jgi:hypothetical protein
VSTGPNARPGTGRGRHSSGEDPLTSAAYSLRSSSSVDGRSYQASRRARELPRDQYEAAISQETQTFTLTDADAATGRYPGGTPQYRYDVPPSPAPAGNGSSNGNIGAHRSAARRDPRDGYTGASTGTGPAHSNGNAHSNGSGGYPYQYGQPGPAAPLTQTPPYGENYDGGADDAQWGSGARDYTPRPAANGARSDSRDSSRADRDRDRDRAAYQAGYPGPYDPRGTNRR